jgi:hypothetical protein
MGERNRILTIVLLCLTIVIVAAMVAIMTYPDVFTDGVKSFLGSRAGAKLLAGLVIVLLVFGGVGLKFRR